MRPKQRLNILLALQIAVVTLFLGRAYQHLFWDAPFRTLLWDENWMSGLVTMFSDMTWREYVTSPKVDTTIQLAIKINGIFYLLCALAALFIRQIPKFVGKILWLGTASLVFLGLLYMKEKFFHLGQFLEYTLQFSAPLFLYFYHYHSSDNQRFGTLLKIATVLTFTCHGLYAIGYYPRPELFLTMTMNILGVGNETAITFLKVAGILDFAISIGLFFPWRIAKFCWIYAIFWGFGTTIARIWGNFYLDFWSEVLHQWGHEMLMRGPHFLLPFAGFLFFLERAKQNGK